MKISLWSFISWLALCVRAHTRFFPDHTILDPTLDVSRGNVYARYNAITRGFTEVVRIVPHREIMSRPLILRSLALRASSLVLFGANRGARTYYRFFSPFRLFIAKHIPPCDESIAKANAQIERIALQRHSGEKTDAWCESVGRWTIKRISRLK